MNFKYADGRGRSEEDLLICAEELDRVFFYRSKRGRVKGTLNIVSKAPLLFRNDMAVTCKKSKRLFWHLKIDPDFVAVVQRWQGCPLHIFEILLDKKIEKNESFLEKIECAVKEITTEVLPRSLRLGHYLLWSLREDLYYRTDYHKLIVVRILSRVLNYGQKF